MPLKKGRSFLSDNVDSLQSLHFLGLFPAVEGWQLGSHLHFYWLFATNIIYGVALALRKGL